MRGYRAKNFLEKIENMPEIREESLLNDYRGYRRANPLRIENFLLEEWREQGDTAHRVPSIRGKRLVIFF